MWQSCQGKCPLLGCTSCLVDANLRASSCSGRLDLFGSPVGLVRRNVVMSARVRAGRASALGCVRLHSQVWCRCSRVDVDLEARRGTRSRTDGRHQAVYGSNLSAIADLLERIELWLHLLDECLPFGTVEFLEQFFCELTVSRVFFWSKDYRGMYLRTT